jgi:hypothetical protein
MSQLPTPADDMSRSPDPHGAITHNIIFDARNGRGIKLGPGSTHGGPRNVESYNTIVDTKQSISVSQPLALSSNVYPGRIHFDSMTCGGFRLSTFQNFGRYG